MLLAMVGYKAEEAGLTCMWRIPGPSSPRSGAQVADGCVRRRSRKGITSARAGRRWVGTRTPALVCLLDARGKMPVEKAIDTEPGTGSAARVGPLEDSRTSSKASPRDPRNRHLQGREAL